MKIVIGINSLTSTPFAAYSNHIQAFMKLGKWAQKDGHQIILNNPERMSIDRMRNQCARIAIEIDADYLLFWDDDVIVPTKMDFIQKMINDNADIVAADVIIRGYPFDTMAFVKKEEEQGLFPIQNLEELIERDGPVFEVEAVGFSLCLIKVELLKKIAAPWFVTGLSNTEDIYFCLKAKEYVPEVKILLDAEITCGHILWQEIIHRTNRKAMKGYLEEMHPQLKPVEEKNPTGDRGNEYLALMEETIG